MKNILAENMLRFGVKNLSDKSKKKLAEQAPVATDQPVNTSALNTAYTAVARDTWPLIQNAIAINGISNKKPTGQMSWTYPAGTKEITQLYTNGVLDKSKLPAYDAEFAKRLDTALNDNAWLTARAKEANIKNKNNDVKLFQTYLMNNITDKTLVKDNGNGGPFNDGIFYAVTLRAFIKYKMQALNNQDSRYLISAKLI